MNDMRNVRIEPSWYTALTEEWSKDYFRGLTSFVRSEYTTDTIFPAPANIFKAFELCPIDKVKVVILGQDPYHGIGQATGLAFAVQSSTTLPPSLKNIFKEIASDLNITPTPNGDLSRWARQGVLLLNATLTVRANSPGSHQNKGWEAFTDAVITKLAAEREHVVFILWGSYAKRKGALIDRTRHLVLEAAHPSPFSAHSGFFGCKHFSATNAYLTKHDLDPIDWH